MIALKHKVRWADFLYSWCETRKHSSRMCTQWSPTVCTSGARHQMSALGSPQVNKFEQISGLGHQMSLAGEGGGGPRVKLFQQVSSVGN